MAINVRFCLDYNTLSSGPAALPEFRNVHPEVFDHRRAGLPHFCGKTVTAQVAIDKEPRFPKKKVPGMWSNPTGQIRLTLVHRYIRIEIGRALTSFKVDRFSTFKRDYLIIFLIDSIVPVETSRYVLLDIRRREFPNITRAPGTTR